MVNFVNVGCEFSDVDRIDLSEIKHNINIETNIGLIEIEINEI